MKLFYLTESMIAVPTDLQNDIMEFVYAYIISFVEGMPEQPEQNIHDMLETMDHIPKHPNLYKAFTFKHSAKVVMSTTIGIQGYTFSYDINKDIKLGIRLVEDKSGPHYGGFHNDHNVIDVNIAQLKSMISNKNFRSVELKYILNEYDNTVEHELMHFIQFNTFAKKNPKQYEPYDGKVTNQSEYIKYATTTTEFIPSIKSEYNTFVNKLSFLKKAGGVRPSDEALLLRYFVGDRSVNVDRYGAYLPDFESNLFHIMKKHNMTLWKKAVKIIMTEHSVQTQTDIPMGGIKRKS